MLPTINVLIRNKLRPELLRRCLTSVSNQQYPAVKAIICSDTPEGYADAVRSSKLYTFPITNITVTPGEGSHFWNTYCNKLKSLVTDGWFFFLDNDDYLVPESLNLLSFWMAKGADGIICQFIRNGRIKPNNRLIRQRAIIKGRIGGGCLVLHSKHKDVADWDNEAAADYRWIKAVSEKVPLIFIPLVLQIAGNNGLHGK